MRRLGFVFVAALAVGGCRCTETTSAVDIPIDLDALRERHAPPQVVVKIEEQTRRRGGGGGCGHSPLCVIVLPFMVYDAVFPERWEEVTITEGGEITFFGSYERSGALIEAHTQEGDRVRYFGRLELKALHRRLYVQLGEATLAEDGAVGARHRTPIQPQVDVLALYTEELAEEDDADDRARLILEAVQWLGPEADAFLEARLRDAEEPDASRAALVKARCKYAAEARKACAAAETSGVKTALAVGACIYHHEELADLSHAHAAAVGALICDDHESEELVSLSWVLGHMRTRGATVAVTCEAPAAQVLVDRALGRTVDTEAAEAAVRGDDPHGHAFAMRLKARGSDRKILFAALDAHPDDEPILKRIGESPQAFTDAELDLIAKSYLASRRAQRKAGTLDLFYRSTLEDAKRDAARRRITAALEAEKPKRRAPLHAALLVLGDRDHAAPAAAIVDDPRPRVPDQPNFVYDDEGLVLYALRRMGCDRATLIAALAEGRPTDASRGPLCTKPMR
ncbi:MAG: hypothetical protein RIT81_14760 [Deltaproteobacteria bacterium]